MRQNPGVSTPPVGRLGAFSLTVWAVAATLSLALTEGATAGSGGVSPKSEADGPNAVFPVRGPPYLR